MAQLQIPAGLEFAALKLTRDADGQVSFDRAPVLAICQASGIDHALFAIEDNIGALIVAWYAAHIAAGGAPDPVQEDLLREVALEDQFGGGLSHPPGRA